MLSRLFNALFNRNQTNNENINEEDEDEIEDYNWGDLYQEDKIDRSNPNRPIGVSFHNLSLITPCLVLKGTSTISKTKRHFAKKIPLNFDEFSLIPLGHESIDENVTLTELVSGQYDTVEFNLFDTSPQIKVLIDTSEIQRYYPIKNFNLYFHRYEKIFITYYEISEILELSVCRFSLQFDNITIPYSDKTQIKTFLIDHNIHNNSIIKIVNLIPLPKGERDFPIFVRGPMNSYHTVFASNDFILDDLIFLDCFKNCNKKRLRFQIPQIHETYLQREYKTFEQIGIQKDFTINSYLSSSDLI